MNNRLRIEKIYKRKITLKSLQKKCECKNRSFDYDIGGFVCDDCNERCS